MCNACVTPDWDHVSLYHPLHVFFNLFFFLWEYMLSFTKNQNITMYTSLYIYGYTYVIICMDIYVYVILCKKWKHGYTYDYILVVIYIDIYITIYIYIYIALLYRNVLKWGNYYYKLFEHQPAASATACALSCIDFSYFQSSPPSLSFDVVHDIRCFLPIIIT